MHDLSPLLLVLLVLLSFVASVAATAIGFGMNIILISILQFFLPPVQLVTLVTLLGLLNACLRMMVLRHVNTEGISARVLVAGVAAVPLGTTMLIVADAGLLKLLFSLVILFAVVPLLGGGASPKAQGKPHSGRGGQWFFGAMGGFTAGAAGMPGPPVVWCGLQQQWERSLAHAVFARYFLVTSVMVVGMLALAGKFDRETVLTSMGLLPVVGVGVFTGSRLRDRISQSQFRQYASLGLVLLAVGSAITVVVEMVWNSGGSLP